MVNPPVRFDYSLKYTMVGGMYPGREVTMSVELKKVNLLRAGYDK